MVPEENVPNEGRSLLDLLDLAFFNYNMDKFEEPQRGRRSAGALSFLGLGTPSNDSRRRSEASQDANYSKNLQELQLNWSETMDSLDQLLDFEIPSFASLALDTAGDNRASKQENSASSKLKFHTLHITEILPDHTVHQIATRKLEQLSPIYHDLDAKAEKQKQALATEHIILSSWELTVFTLFRSLTSQMPYATSSFDHMHFFSSELPVDGNIDQLDSREKIQRLISQFKMDKNRMLVILLTRLL